MMNTIDGRARATLAAVCLSLGAGPLACSHGADAGERDRPAGNSVAPRVVEVRTYTVPRTSLSRFGNPAVTDEVLARAARAGLTFTDLPAIGSGLARTGRNEFVALTDRGPNASDSGRRAFPLPEFAPSIVRLSLADGEAAIDEVLPLRDSHGALITGFSNSGTEEALYGARDADKPLSPHPNGVDTEAIRQLPDGRFVLAEEYSPSILVVSAEGEVLVRYTPVSKPLTGATYPVRAILPDVLVHRRDNDGFESLAVSDDGRFAYAVVQSPLGRPRDARYKDARVMRIIKVDLADPLNATVAGQYLGLTSPASRYGNGADQKDVVWSDAEWIAPDRLLVLERHGKAARVMLVDLRDATNVLGREHGGDLTFEDVATDLAAMGVSPARVTEVFSTADAPQIDGVKLEGLTVNAPDEIAIANDNDFGLGDRSGERARVWIVKFDRFLFQARE